MITIEAQIAELKREAAIRNRVYPQWVIKGRMKREDADWYMARLSAAIATLENLRVTQQTRANAPVRAMPVPDEAKPEARRRTASAPPAPLGSLP